MISLLNSSKRTKSVYASFPLIFNERLYYEKTYVNAREPDQVMEMLEDENVTIELLQYSERRQGGKLLAFYEESSRKFLFPDKTLTKKDGLDREILLSRTAKFQGINPKLEFSTSTTMQEARVSTSLHRTLLENPPFLPPDNEIQHQSDSSTSEQEEETVPIMHSTRVQTPKPVHSKTPKRTQKHCVCECPRRPENNGEVVVKSRSLSPRLKRSLRRRSGDPKPPFKTGKADESIISRRDFPPSPSMKRRAKMRSSLPSTPLPADGDPLPCQDCRVPHKDCLVCQAYFKVYGNEFLQYRFGPDRQLRSASTPSLAMYQTPARARLPGSAPTSDDVAYSRPLSERKKIFHAESEGYSSYKESSSNSDEMHERVKKLLAKTKVYSNGYSSSSDVDSDQDSLFSLQELRSEIDDAREEALNRSYDDPENPSLGVRLDRSITVPLDDNEYWSNKKYLYTGLDHRQTFDQSLQTIYHDLYNKATQVRP
ncbi:spermatogenesis-associated protein 6-like isoform X2 [Dendronephthya gigantea]|uniref:spermatogenesis-associated protein 6-like isoform X2 n=1 Tax=Dendronephthya gigantea TaxID=151771 RepID=UPI00106A9E10|nr:spermatogenesis-associated protein 6-like isoform X2 [Dendronephthya gigantea]